LRYVFDFRFVIGLLSQFRGERARESIFDSQRHERTVAHPETAPDFQSTPYSMVCAMGTEKTLRDAMPRKLTKSALPPGSAIVPARGYAAGSERS